MSLTSDLNIFTPSPIEQAMQETRTEIIGANIPLPSSDVALPCEFKVPASPDFTDFSNTLLELECRIQFNEQKDEDKGIPDGTEIALINNALMSFFSGIQIALNNTIVFSNNNCFAWTAYLDVLAKYKADARKSWLEASGYEDEKSSANITDKGKTRFKHFIKSGTGRYIGPIQHSFFLNRKFMLPGIEVVITLFRNKPEFVLLYQNDPKQPRSFIVTFDRCSLHIVRKKLHSDFNLLMSQQLLKTPAVYEYVDIVLKPIIIPNTVFAVDTSIIDSGLLPDRIEMVQLNQQAATGSLRYNPLLFQSFNLQSLTLEKNGQAVQAPYQLDFSNGNYVRPFIDYFRNSGGCLHSSGCSPISFENYASGFMIISFNLTNFDECDHTLKSAPEHGSLRLKMLYDSSKTRATDDSIVVMCFLKYKKQFSVDHMRTVSR
jgi:hypothetical protein